MQFAGHDLQRPNHLPHRIHHAWPEATFTPSDTALVKKKARYLIQLDTDHHGNDLSLTVGCPLA